MNTKIEDPDPSASSRISKETRVWGADGTTETHVRSEIRDGDRGRLRWSS